MNTFAKGKEGENKAVKYLQTHGYKIVEKNYYCKGGEIDIIAHKNEVFHFVEVKSGIGFEPVYNITPAKIKRIIKCIYQYLKKHKIKSAFCLDAIIIKENDIEFIKNITL
jgi:putative endonuclease